jgi:hypothetical protein
MRLCAEAEEIGFHPVNEGQGAGRESVVTRGTATHVG